MTRNRLVSAIGLPSRRTVGVLFVALAMVLAGCGGGGNGGGGSGGGGGGEGSGGGATTAGGGGTSAATCSLAFWRLLGGRHCCSNRIGRASRWSGEKVRNRSAG